MNPWTPTPRLEAAASRALPAEENPWTPTPTLEAAASRLLPAEGPPGRIRRECCSSRSRSEVRRSRHSGRRGRGT
jgi:hypothetical protein